MGLASECFTIFQATRKNPKHSDTRKKCDNHPKIRTRWLYRTVMRPKDADGMANSVDSADRTDLGLHCLPRHSVDPADQCSFRGSLIWVYTVCPKT